MTALPLRGFPLPPLKAPLSCTPSPQSRQTKGLPSSPVKEVANILLITNVMKFKFLRMTTLSTVHQLKVFKTHRPMRRLQSFREGVGDP